MKETDKFKFKNFGTPQEIIDEDEYFNPQTKEEKIFGCLIGIIYFIVVVLIFNFLV